MADDTAQRDRINPTDRPGAEAEIDVFAAVEVVFVKSAELLPQCAPDDHAGTGDGGYGAYRVQPPHERWRNRTDMKRLAGNSDNEARVVDRAGAGIELDITDQSGAVAQRRVRGEHRLEPAGQEDQIVVEQREKLASRD